jgi:hypothetical protein
MGTRGFIIIKFSNKIITLYNHYDSYPEALGCQLFIELIQLLKKYKIDELISKFETLNIVNDNIDVTEDDIKNLKSYTNLKVSKQSDRDWYCLLHQCQGSIIKVLESGYALDMPTFGWIEYEYIIDLINMKYICKKGNEEELWNINLSVDELGSYYVKNLI